MRNLLRGMLVVICCMAGIAAADEKNILVTSGSDRATPIAVVPFGWQGGSVLPDDMAQIVSDDLRNSGYYAPIPKGNMISQPNQASEVVFRDWKAVGAQYLMVGNITPAGGRLQIQYTLFNVATEQQVLTGSVSGTAEQLRDMAHYISDQSFEKLTGIKGAFSTRLLYVTAERFSVDNTRYTLQRFKAALEQPEVFLLGQAAHVQHRDLVTVQCPAFTQRIVALGRMKQLAVDTAGEHAQALEMAALQLQALAGAGHQGQGRAVMEPAQIVGQHPAQHTQAVLVGVLLEIGMEATHHADPQAPCRT